eukprot:SAG31_NODE_4471_length_3205_cov_2.753059_2_plen_343_part_00
MGKPNDWVSTVSVMASMRPKSWILSHHAHLATSSAHRTLHSQGKPDSFAVQIAANTVPGVAEALAPPFSATTVVEDIAQKIVVMDICKNYFEYKCCTMCGFPQITLEGSEADWRLLREASERLLERCTPDFQKQWCVQSRATSWLASCRCAGKPFPFSKQTWRPAVKHENCCRRESLLPLLDKLVAARSGEVDATFWNSMCKRGGTSGSGARTWFNGWFNILFPYIDRRPNRYCVPYSPDAGYVREGLVYDKREDDMFGAKLDFSARSKNGPDGDEKWSRGPDCEDFGNGMSCAPVEWDYLGRSVPLDFNAGFVGATQDPNTLEIRPAVGWFITHRSVEPNE